MKKQISKIKMFVKEHKLEVITVVSIGTAILLWPKAPKALKKTASSVLVKDIEISERLKALGCTELWHEGKFINAILDSVSIMDIGALGSEIINSGLGTAETTVSLVLSLPEIL